MNYLLSWSSFFNNTFGFSAAGVFSRTGRVFLDYIYRVARQSPQAPGLEHKIVDKHHRFFDAIQHNFLEVHIPRYCRETLPRDQFRNVLKRCTLVWRLFYFLWAGINVRISNHFRCQSPLECPHTARLQKGNNSLICTGWKTKSYQLDPTALLSKHCTSLCLPRVLLYTVVGAFIPTSDSRGRRLSLPLPTGCQLSVFKYSVLRGRASQALFTRHRGRRESWEWRVSYDGWWSSFLSDEVQTLSLVQSTRSLLTA